MAESLADLARKALADVERVIGRLDAGGFDSFARATASWSAERLSTLCSAALNERLVSTFNQLPKHGSDLVGSYGSPAQEPRRVRTDINYRGRNPKAALARIENHRD